LLPLVDRSLVKSTEAVIESQITPYSFQTETSIAEWHYLTGQKYKDAKEVIELLMQNVSRNGTMLLNITQHARGDLDPEVVRICKDIGAWLNTRNQGNVYATLLNWDGNPVTLSALHIGGTTLGKVSNVELLGSDIPIKFIQDDKGLTVIPDRLPQILPEISDKSLASKCRVLRITHDKGWLNDDDSGVKAPGWLRKCNLGTGDFNNDLTVSDTPGDIWTCSFTGTSVKVIAPKEVGAGKIEILIDGKTRATADLSIVGTRQAQQVLDEISGLISGKHSISIVNLGSGPVTIDALIVR